MHTRVNSLLFVLIPVSFTSIDGTNSSQKGREHASNRINSAAIRTNNPWEISVLAPARRLLPSAQSMSKLQFDRDHPVEQKFPIGGRERGLESGKRENRRVFLVECSFALVIRPAVRSACRRVQRVPPASSSIHLVDARISRCNRLRIPHSPEITRV